MIVVESNVVAYLYLPGEYTAAAEALLEHDPDWAALVLWRSEFRNILAGYLRRRTLTFDQACGLQSEAEDLLAGSEFEVDSNPCSNWCETATVRLTTVSSSRLRSNSIPSLSRWTRSCSRPSRNALCVSRQPPAPARAGCRSARRRSPGSRARASSPPSRSRRRD